MGTVKVPAPVTIAINRFVHCAAKLNHFSRQNKAIV
jgi:hypothetical protein